MPPNNKKLSPLAIASFILAFVLPPVGFLLSFFAKKDIKQRGLGGDGLATAAMVIGIVLSILGIIVIALLALVFGALFTLFGESKGKTNFQPIAQQMDKLGATQLCQRSSNDLDSVTPWSGAYYKIPESSNLNEKIKTMATQQGYTLSPNTEYVEFIKGPQTYEEPHLREVFIENSEYLKGLGNDGSSLSIEIHHKTPVTLLHCAYGSEDAAELKKDVADNSNAIVYIRRAGTN